MANPRARRRILVIIGMLVVLTAGLLWKLPAYQAYRVLLPPSARVLASDFSGSVWNGRAERVSVDGYALGAVAWQLRFASLLRGRADVAWQLDGRELEGGGRLISALSDSGWRLEDVNLRAPASWLQVIVQEPFLQFEGMLDADFASMRFDGEGYLESADGLCRWDAAAIGGRLATALGDLRVEFSPTVSGVLGTLGDGGGPLGLEGTVRLEGRQYSVDAYLRARDDAPALRQAITVLASAAGDGGRARLGISGPLLPLGQWVQ